MVPEASGVMTRARVGTLGPVLALALASLPGGCAPEPKLELGAQCDLSSDCEAPLACRLDRCRVECATARDCEVGAACLLDGQGLGACQLPDEQECTANSDCASILVCRFRQCVNECRIDRDCPPGSTCEPDSAGDRACIDAAEQGCSSHRDCPAPLRCASDGLCRPECVNDRDCGGGTVCEEGRCRPPTVNFDGGMDGGGPDGGATDAAMDGGTDGGTGGGVDGGAADASAVALLENVVQVETAKSETTCAVMDTGSLLCWGDFAFDGRLATRPTDFGGLSDAQQVSLGERFGCVLRGAGAVQCWGANWAGQLGDGTSTDSATLVDVAGLPAGVVEVSAGHSHACARTGTGEVWCWGLNQALQSGGTGYTQPTPMRIGTFSDAATVSAGYDHVCVLQTGDTVSCWGGNSWYQLADDTLNQSATPLAVAGIDDATAMRVGNSTSCALRSSGEVWCWGAQSGGQLGDGATSGSKLVPGPVTGLSDATLLAMGVSHSCASRAGGEVLCWGDNARGQLGNGLWVDEATTPVRVLGLSDVTALAAGHMHTCALRAGGAVSCWGSNIRGELGNGTLGGSTNRPSPVLAP